jgi:hypothetical protein
VERSANRCGSCLSTIGNALNSYIWISPPWRQHTEQQLPSSLSLSWIYYSAQILLLGAEVTHVYANKHGSRVEPGMSNSDQPPEH